ncbi:MAG: tetratricopeptide repeat protein, partial [Candidatus Sericytochromatia bacterium]|nr:tetratricopeptide repeat protein [Candidatus Sericytochromatia bacterium]
KIENNETIDFPYWADIDTIDLRVTLRKAYQIDQDIYDNLAKNASKSILDKYTWVKINDIIKDNLNELKSKPIKRDLQKDFNNKVLEGLQALTNGKFDESLKVLQEAFDIDPKNANLNFYLANIMMTKSDLPKALSFIITSLNIDANNEDYTNLLGIILYKMSYYDLAQRVFEKIVYLMPEHTGAKESLKVIDLMTDEQLNNPIKINIDPNTYNFIEQITKNTDTKKTATLSVCILTKNEENSIEKAIRSVKKIADEIIILDTGSVDKTVKLVQDSGVKIFHTKWNDDFAHARNELMSHATMDWVLMLDADECLSESSSEKVKAILTNLDKTKVYLPRIINHIDKNNMDEKQEHYVVRILPNNKDIRYIRAIHEYPIINNDLLDSENIREIELIHYGYTNKAVISKNKVVRNRLILQKMFDQDPTDPLNSFYLAENYKDENNFDKVLYFSENTLNILENKQNVSLRHQYQNIFEMSQVNILDALIILDKKEEARSKFELFTNYLAKRPDFWFLYGNLELKSNNNDQAIKYYHQALSLRDQHLFSALDLGSVSWKPLSIISNIYFKKGDLYNSLTYLKRAIKEAPDNIDLYHDLASIYSKTGELDLLENTLKSFISYLNNTSLVNLLETITPIYFEKNSQDKLYILLEDIRKEKFKGSLNEDSITLTEKLIEIYYQILKIESKSSIKYSIACCYSFIEDLDKAETIFTELISLNDLEVDSLHNLASIALNQKNIDKAEQLYQKVLSIDNFHSDTYLSLIKLHVFKKEYLKSDEYLKKLAEIDPDNQQLSTMEFELAKVSGDKKLASDMYAAMLFKDKF